jgi:deoxyhypusine synthase
MQNEPDYDSQREVYTKVVKAGKRTYFFDIKTTKGQDHFLTITESKKVNLNGKEVFQKHKIFLYKEDFEKFSETILEVIEKANELNMNENSNTSITTDIHFEDL